MKYIYPFVFVLILTGCFSNETPSKEDQPTVPANSDTRQNQAGQVLVTNLNVPWQINVLGPAEFYLSERAGNIVHAKDGSIQREPLQLSKQIVSRTEGGFLGFLLIENTSPMQAYIYHTYTEQGQLLNRIVKVQKNGTEWREIDVIIENIPGSPIHNGGRLQIGPDGKLYITTGDAGEQALAQNLNSLAGKILRVNLDGSIPNDNPFKGSPIYSYGHRNPQGMAWTDDGQMYSSEHGASAHDEINRIVPGGNYGWPIIQGDEEREGMITPLFHSGNQTWAPSGMDAIGSRLYVACLAGEQIRVFDLAQQTDRMWASGFGRVRDINISDGVLYAVTSNRDGRGTPTEEDDRLIQFQLD
ncbi:sorbosone dehydrogenase family protein [Alkalihalobacillus sp. AL-G]|uniref:PQQ-dependent sugar dehydrogenase n=1 Tax=Alkalihalobacillus sp. AL-G TaxID=2926399 RepID=UPI002729D6CA|nr:PQQ-dependent sugar dehydrogenase [Alkalihalobacillus sp. AL-G]WLD92726.1 PQQ-dependent sugar dehydrogenase [Alkalihalobacillus sp. AL-G]